jgi:hypothetical protein
MAITAMLSGTLQISAEFVLPGHLAKELKPTLANPLDPPEYSFNI